MNYDTLDYLIPPVRKRCGNNKLTKNITGDGRKSKRLKSTAQPNFTQISHSRKTDVEKSSAGLKNITNKLLLQQFSISNFIKKKQEIHKLNSYSKNQKNSIPTSNVIKITVVPITTVTQPSQVVLKRYRLVKKIHRTVSNTNTCINDNTPRLQKHRRENCDIRETSSADLFQPKWERNTKYDDIALNRMTYTKTILNSLNMNYKGRPGRAKHESYEAQSSPKNGRKSYKAIKEGCMCNNPKVNTVLNDMNSPKNRVTIVGRFGINENDQYVLNCAASLNNKLMDTFTSKQNLSSPSIEEFENDDGIEKITRATQANMDMCFSTDEAKNSNSSDKNVQCHCRIAKDVATSVSECKFRESTEHTNPLIVISVYPTKGGEGIKDLGDLIRINHLPESKKDDKNLSMNFRTMEQTLGNTSDQKRITRSPEKRSSSPPNKANDKGKVENRPRRNRSPTPPNKKNHSSDIEKIPLRSRSRSPPIKSTVKETNKNKLSRQISQKSVKSTDRQKRQPRVNKLSPQKDRSIRNPVMINTAQTSKINPLKGSHGGIKETTAKKNKIKKAIVDSYTKRMLMSEKGKNSLPRVDVKPSSNPSSITIDIDADNERYRVLLLQDKLNTDLSIRKTMKTDKQKTLNGVRNIGRGISNDDYMESFRVLKNTTIPGQDLEESNQLKNLQDLENGTPGLNIRDSLEMRHWHEDGEEEQVKKNSYKDYEPTIKIRHKTVNNHADNEDLLSAPVKHYRGDQCCVPNPIARDQEIRNLLGIKKPRPGKSEFVQEVFPEFIGQKMQYNLHPGECVGSKSSVSRQYYSTLNETRNEINTNDQPKYIQAWTQCDESTINSYKQMILNRNIQVFLQVEQFTKQKPIMLSRKQYEKVKKTIQKNVSKEISQEKRRINKSTKCSVVSIGEIRKTRKQQTSNIKICRTVQAEHNSVHMKINRSILNCFQENRPLKLHTPENIKKDDRHFNASPRQVASSMEIRFPSLAHLRHVTFSSNNIKSKPASLVCLTEKNCPSVQTIFKGHKKCVTPNLGTSAYSLYLDEDINSSDVKNTSQPYDEKPKKPFLRRLMSCLVMRSNRASEAILPRGYEQPSMINSFDSYHINTSLGAIELTSSMYDTSASFYSNHTILPIARMKRGFLSSVRGFITNLKAR